MVGRPPATRRTAASRLFRRRPAASGRAPAVLGALARPSAPPARAPQRRRRSADQQTPQRVPRTSGGSTCSASRRLSGAGGYAGDARWPVSRREVRSGCSACRTFHYRAAKRRRARSTYRHAALPCASTRTEFERRERADESAARAGVERPPGAIPAHIRRGLGRREIPEVGDRSCIEDEAAAAVLAHRSRALGEGVEGRAAHSPITRRPKSAA